MTSYVRPSTIGDALDQLAKGGRLVLAGGTDVYPSAGAVLAGDVVDISGIDELRGISHGDGLRIGAGTTWSAISEAELPPAFWALQQAARHVGGRQIQNVGTIGGNLCNASPAADGVPPLLVLGAMVDLASATGARRMVLSDYILGVRRTALLPGELVTAVHVPESMLAGRSAFLKLGARAYLVISIAMVAVRLVVQRDQVVEAAIAVGACSAVAQRLPQVESAILGARASQAARAVRREDLAAGLSPIDDIRATADYRLDVATEMVRRCIAQVAV